MRKWVERSAIILFLIPFGFFLANSFSNAYGRQPDPTQPPPVEVLEPGESVTFIVEASRNSDVAYIIEVLPPRDGVSIRFQTSLGRVIEEREFDSRFERIIVPRGTVIYAITIINGSEASILYVVNSRMLDPLRTPEPAETPEATDEPLATPEATDEPLATPEATDEPLATPEATEPPPETPTPDGTPEATDEPNSDR